MYDVEIVEAPANRLLGLPHRGPHPEIGKAFGTMFDRVGRAPIWLPASGRAASDAPSFEIHLNDPNDTAEADLLTEFCLPLA